MFMRVTATASRRKLLVICARSNQGFGTHHAAVAVVKTCQVARRAPLPEGAGGLLVVEVLVSLSLSELASARFSGATSGGPRQRLSPVSLPRPFVRAARVREDMSARVVDDARSSAPFP